MIGIRKITFRQLTRESDKIFQNDIHILLLKILEYYQSFEEYNEDEEIIIVKILIKELTNISMNHFGLLQISLAYLHQKSSSK